MNFKKIFLNVVIIVSLMCIGVTLWGKYSEQANYADNVDETKTDLANEIPTCENGIVKTNTTNDIKNYSPDELMGSIYIPKFDLVIPLYMENETDETNWSLEVGVVMDSSGSYPHGDSATVVYGHRQYDFQVLKDIEVDDDIIISIEDNVYLYEVSEIEIVDETQVDQVFTDDNELVLYTCYPFYWGAPTNERYVVHASPVDTLTC